MARKSNGQPSTIGMIAFPLSDGEQKAKSHEHAQICKEIDQLTADAAAAASDARKKLRTLNNRRRVLQECVLTASEMRPAQEHFGFDKSPKKLDGKWPDDAGPTAPSKKSKGKSADA